MCLNMCPNFGHIMDIFWTFPCDSDMFHVPFYKCPNERPEVKTHFGHYEQGWTCFGHQLDTFWVLVTFLDTLWTLLVTLRPKCVRPYIVLQCPRNGGGRARHVWVERFLGLKVMSMGIQ